MEAVDCWSKPYVEERDDISAEVRLLREGPPYSLRDPQPPPPPPTPSSLPATLPAYMEALEGNIIGVFQPMPYIGMAIPGIGAMFGTPMFMLIPPNALALDPRSHSSLAAASAC